MLFTQVHTSRFAPATALYSFCIRNHESAAVEVSVKLLTGLKMMELEALPTLDDNAFLDHEIKMLEEQHTNLLQSVAQIETSRSKAEQLVGMMEQRGLWFGVLGLVLVVLVNWGYQREIRKTFK
jgi:hypothetical protein